MTLTQSERAALLDGLETIQVTGSPLTRIPANHTAEDVLQALSIDLNAYQHTRTGNHLALMLPSGSKGRLEARLTEDGKLVPKAVDGGFPSDQQIELIAREFPEDDLFETLCDTSRLQEYATHILKIKEDAINAAIQARQDELKAKVESIADLAIFDHPTYGVQAERNLNALAVLVELTKQEQEEQE